MSDNPFSQLDAYERRHLAMHLGAAERAEELHLLLAYETYAHRNAWYELKEACGETADYLADLLLAWQLEDESLITYSRIPVRQSIGRQCRYALINASLRSIAGDIPPALLAALVKHLVWTPEQALAYAQQIVVPAARGMALAKLTLYFQGERRESLLREALQTVLAVDLEVYSEALDDVVPLVSETVVRETLANVRDTEVLVCFVPRLATLGYESEALAEARVIPADAISGLRDRAQALADVAVFLSEPQRYQVLKEAHAVASQIQAALHCFVALERVASRFAECGYLDDALAAAREITWTLQHERVLAILVQPLALHGRVAEARSIADQISFWHLYAEARIGLAPFMPDPERLQLLSEALEAARHNEDDPWWPDRIRVRGVIATQLKEPFRQQLLQEAVTTALAIRDEYQRATALGGLAPLLPKELLRQTLTITRIHDEHVIGRCLGVLARCLQGAQQNQVESAALAIMQHVPDVHDRVHVLTELASYLHSPRREQAFREVLAAVRLLQTASTRAEALQNLAGMLPETLYQDALGVAYEIEDESLRARTLTALVPHLPHSLVQETLGVVLKFKDDNARAQLLIALAPCLPQSFLQQALDIARQALTEPRRTKVLAAFVPFLEVEQVLTVQDEIVAFVNSTGIVRVLVALTLRLAELSQRDAALQLVRLIRSPEERVDALTGMARHLVDPHDVIAEAIAEAQKIMPARAQADALEHLAAAVPASLRATHLHRALSAAHKIDNQHERSNILASLASRMTEVGLHDEALATARQIPDELNRVAALVQIARCLPKPFYAQCWREPLTLALSISDSLGRSRAIAEVVLHAPQPFKRQALAELDLATLLGEYLNLVAQLAPHLPEPMLLETVDLVLEWDNSPIREDGLAALAPRLARLPRSKAMSLWQKAVRRLSSRTRPDGLSDLGTLAPFIVMLGKRPVLVDISDVIQDVSRWWA